MKLLSPLSVSPYLKIVTHFDGIKKYLEIIEGAVERSLNGGARCCIQVASHSG